VKPDALLGYAEQPNPIPPQFTDSIVPITGGVVCKLLG